MYATGNWHYDAYPQKFRPGETYKIVCDPIIHRIPRSVEYPLRDYDRRTVVVDQDPDQQHRASWPDDNGLVRVILPPRTDKSPTKSLYILGSLLRKDNV